MNNFLIKLLLVLGCFTTVLAKGQTLISPITITMPANPPANTADWATAMPPVMILAQGKMQNGQLNGFVQESRILVTIKSGGNKVCGGYTPQTAPLSNFNTPTKNWSGANAVGLLGQNCVLKSGNYELCVQFYAPGAAQVILIGESCKPFTIKETNQESYSPPQNIAPANEKTLTDKEAKTPLIFRWTPIVPKPQGAVTYKLKVWQLMQRQTATTAIKSNRPMVEKEINNQTQFVKNNLMGDIEMLNGSANLVWNVQALNENGRVLGTSEPTAFRIAVGNTGGLFELDTTQYAIQCVGLNSAGKYLFKVSNLKIKNINTNPTNCIANSGTSTTNLSNYVISQIPSSYTISNIVPATIPVINVGTPQSFSFDVESNSPTPGSLMLKVLFHSSCTGPAGTDDVPVPISIKFDDLPSCKCTACDNIKIDVTQNATTGQNGNNVKFTQAVSVTSLPNNAPINIKSITAEILYVDIKKDDAQCYSCDKNSNHFGKFVKATCSNQNFLPNAGQPLNGAGEVVFEPLGMVNQPSQSFPLTNASLGFEIAAPDLNRCCKDVVTVCVKYTIVTTDCKSCSVNKCYTINRAN